MSILSPKTRFATKCAGDVTTYAYDDLDRLVTETTSSGVRKRIYRGDGTLFVTVDRNGKGVRHMYDRLDRLRLERWYADEAQALAGSGDGTFQRTDEFAFRYDALGRLSQQSHVEASSGRRIVDSFQYDGLDRLVERSNQRNPPMNAITTPIVNYLLAFIGVYRRFHHLLCIPSRTSRRRGSSSRHFTPSER